MTHSNKRFVAGAPPQVVEMEKNKQADAEAKINSLEEALRNFGFEIADSPEMPRV